MQRKRKIPNRPDFKRATKRAYDFLVELGIKALPVDPFKIVKLYDSHWHLLGWNELKIATGKDDPFYLKRDKAEAKTKIIRGTNEYLIVYDESYSRERIRWTIAHEIGHILLGHLVYFEETALNRGGLTKRQYGVLEVEAHWFAEALLAPNVVLYSYGIKDSQEIAFLCDISKKSSDKCERHLRKFYPNDPVVEGTLLRNFYEFFYKEGFRQSITEGIYKFYSSFLYDDFYKICRICRNCNAYVVNKKQKYCHVCGKEMPDWDFPYKDFPSGTEFDIGVLLYLQGKFFPYIETDAINKVLFCPVCRNHDFSVGSEYCKICGAPIINRCLHENTVLAGHCRYCPDCGEVTKFQDLNLFNHLKEVDLPDLLTYGGGYYADYIEYEHWNYIISTFKNNLELYSALVGTRAIRDEGSFVIFAHDNMSRNVILNHKELIKSSIKKYGQTIIKDVRCL